VGLTDNEDTEQRLPSLPNC